MVGLGLQVSQAVNYNEKLPGGVKVGPGARPKKEVIAEPPDSNRAPFSKSNGADLPSQTSCVWTQDKTHQRELKKRSQLV